MTSLIQKLIIVTGFLLIISQITSCSHHSNNKGSGEATGQEIDVEELTKSPHESLSR